MQWWHKKGNFTKMLQIFIYKTLLTEGLAGASTLICHGINAYYSLWMKTNECVEE